MHAYACTYLLDEGEVERPVKTLIEFPVLGVLCRPRRGSWEKLLSESELDAKDPTDPDSAALRRTGR